MTSRTLKENDGFIYILTNTYIPNIYKIGYSKRGGAERAKEMSGTGVPGNWELARQWPVMDAYKTEQYVFSELEEYRIKKQEMFNFIGTSLENVIKTIDILLSLRQKSLIEYIENLNRYELRHKKTVKAVEQALIAEQYDIEYITYVRETINRVNKESALLGINNSKSANKKLVIYILVTVALIVLLVTQFGMGSLLFYGFFAIVMFFMVASIIANNDDIKTFNEKILEYSLKSLPTNLTELKPIMSELGIDHIINIKNIKINMKKDYRSIALEAVYKGMVLTESYPLSERRLCSEKEALIEFVMHIESEERSFDALRPQRI